MILMFFMIFMIVMFFHVFSFVFHDFQIFFYDFHVFRVGPARPQMWMSGVAPSIEIYKKLKLDKGHWGRSQQLILPDHLNSWSQQIISTADLTR